MTLPEPDLARVLADPSRHRILELVRASDGPATIAVLTAATGLTHNAVRQHLQRLRDAGLVVEAVEERHAAGRPRLLYTAGRVEEPYARLARVLLRALAERRAPRAAGRTVGREEAAAHAGEDAVDAFVAEAMRQGFAPRRDGRTVVLDRCPIADVAAADPARVCALHRGLAEGFLHALGGCEVSAFVARAPHAAGCEVHIGGGGS